jgi:hypothetical protein
MQTTHHIQNRLIIPLLAALFAAFLLPGCSKTPEDHARIASDPGVRFEKRMASVQALAAANDQMLLASVAATSHDLDIKRAAADKLDEPQAMAAFAKKVSQPDRAGAELAGEVMSKTGDRRLLADIAANAASVSVRIEAAALLDDQAALADIAKSTRLPDIIPKLVERLTDQAALSSIAKTNATQERVWGPALDKLDDQPLLAALAKDAARHPNLSAKAAGKLRDQTVLEEIARSALPDAVRKVAIAGLTNQRALADIAGNDSDASIRLTATGRLTDQPALAAIVKSDAGKNVRLKAVERLTDQRTLADFVKNAKYDENDPGEEVPSAALKKITDQQTLADIALNEDAWQSVRTGAASRLTDQRQVEGIINTINKKRGAGRRGGLTQDNWDVLRAAVGNLADQSMLAEIAKNDKSVDMRTAAVGKLTVQDALADVAKSDEDSGIAWEALRRLDDQRLLAETATASRHGQIRAGALERIKDSQALDSLARHGDAAPEIRLLAVWRLADKPLLSALAKDAPDDRVRRAAASKLSENRLRGAERGKIMDLINEGKLLAEINGDNIQNLNIVLRKLTPHPLEVTIPAGSYFVCDNPKAQNMVSTADVTTTLRGDSQSARIPAACANKPKDIPGKRDSFTLSTLPNADELAKLMAALGGKKVSYHTKQAAVWIVTDDADYGDLDTLRTVSQYTPRIPGVAYGTRAINEPEAAAAMRLCDEAGIDIKTKAIWGDCAKILAGLKAGELKNWLKIFSGLVVRAHKREVTELVVSPDGNLLASSDNDGEIKLWSLPDGAFVRMLEHEHSMSALALSLDGKWLVSGGLNDDMRLWSLPAGKLVKTENRKEHESVMAAAFSPDGKWFVTGDNDGFIKLWSLPDGSLIKTLEKQGHSSGCLALSPDGKLLATQAGETIKLLSLPDGVPVGTLEGIENVLISLTISSDGKQLISAERDRNSPVKLWSLPDGRLLKNMEKKHIVYPGEISPDGKWLLDKGGGRRGRATVWSLPEDTLVCTLEDAIEPWSAAFASDNTLLATGDKNGNIKLWSLPDGKLIKTLESE